MEFSDPLPLNKKLKKFKDKLMGVIYFPLKYTIKSGDDDMFSYIMRNSENDDLFPQESLLFIKKALKKSKKEYYFKKERLEINNIFDTYKSLSDKDLVYLYLTDSLVFDLVKKYLKKIFFENISKYTDIDGDIYEFLDQWKKYDEESEKKGEINRLKFVEVKDLTFIIYNFYMDLYDKYGIFEFDVNQLSKGKIESWTDTRQRDMIFTELLKLSDFNECYKKVIEN